MDVLNFLGGNGLFLILGIVLVVVYFYNRKKDVNEQYSYNKTIFI